MSIHLAIQSARKVRKPANKQSDEEWWVMHPSNDAILAYCTTELEADEVIAQFNSVGSEVHTISLSMRIRSSAYRKAVKQVEDWVAKLTNLPEGFENLDILSR